MSEKRGNNSPSNDPQRQIARLWVTAQPSISAYIWSCVRDFHTAEDLLQDVAQDVAASFSRYDPDKPFVAWALGIARFKVIDHYRRSDSDLHLFDHEALDHLCTAFTDTFAQSSPKREALDYCLERLKGKSRQALEMRYELDMKPAKIAERIGTSSGSVRVMLTRIRNALSKCVKQRLQQIEGGGND